MQEEPKTSGRVGIALEATVFICGALVMVYEINGSRILAPYIGTSTYVWTSLIGVILGSLSLGYWLGGRIADRRPDVKILASAIFLAGGLVSATILTKDLVLASIAAVRSGLEIKSVLAALILFAPASIALGFVVPYAAKLRMISLADSGKTVGRLYALSTIGSIAGTFAAGFFLIPFVGSTRTLYLIAGILFAVSLLLAPFAFTRLNLTALTLFVLGIFGNEITSQYERRTISLHDIDTQYSRISVFHTTDPRSGKPIQAIATDPYFLQSAMFLDSDELVFRYTPYYHLIRHFKPDFKRSLMIGGAGYSFPQEYLRTYPDAKIDVVEIDPQVTEIARKFFRLKDDPRLNIFHADARVFLNNSEGGQYDALLMDAFGSLFSVPYQLTTVEAVREMHRALTDDGVVVFNLGSSINGPSSGFLQAELATYRSVFDQVYLFKVNSDYSDSELQNLIVVASKSGRVKPMRSEDKYVDDLLVHHYTEPVAKEIGILTDDLAPVEYYNSIAQNAHRSGWGN